MGFLVTGGLPVLRLVLLGFMSVALSAEADTQDPLFIVAGVTHQHDDNLFRLPSGVDKRPFIGRASGAEDITVTSVMLHVNKSYSLQRFELEAGVNDYRFRNFSYLDYTARPYKARWRWYLTPSLHGNLLTERDESTSSFSDYHGYTKRNTKTEKNERFDAELELGSAWRLLGGLAKSSSENTEPTEGENDWRKEITDLGLRYVFPSGNSLGYLFRTADGKYLKQRAYPGGLSGNRDFEDREHAFSLVWKAGGKTLFNARLGYLDRQHKGSSLRDFDGLVGNLTLDWDVTGKTHLRTSVSRDLWSSQNPYSSYVESDRLSISPSWQISSKTALRLQYDLARRNYLGAVAQTPMNGRRDHQRTALIALEWSPMRDLTLSLSGRRETRDANRPGLDYKSNIVSLSANLGF